MDFRRATTITKRHGRLEKRTITVSRRLSGYSDLPHLAQVFQVESWASLSAGYSRHEVCYGITSMPVSAASPERLLALVQGQWGIENGLPYRRICKIIQGEISGDSIGVVMVDRCQ